MGVDEGRETPRSRAPQVLSPELVGRSEQTAALADRVDDLGRGCGGAVVLLGEAGSGKTRLAREVAELTRGRGIPVLSGRSVPGVHPVPYRPLTEAFLAAFRSAPPPDAPELVGFGGHLGRLVPGWRVPGDAAPTGGSGADESPVLLGEAVARLLGVVGHARSSVLVLEDLHWADAETLATVEYLADALRDVPVLCVVTARPEGAAEEMLGRLERRDPTSTLRLAPLDAAEVGRMVAGCLAMPAAPPDLVEFVRAHSDGNPFLVEELLAGLVASGVLHFADGAWTRHGDLVPTVPASLRESIRRRFAGLDPVARRVTAAAALMGRRFDWELLPGVAEVDGRAVVDGLRAAVDEQLIAVEGTEFTFRHALTREAVLHDLLPPDRLDLARRAWPAVERAHPGLPGATCELAAELAEAAGEPVAAAGRLVESARRALANGALTSAEATARRARRLVGEGETAALDAEEVLVHVLVAAGKPGPAIDLGRDLVGRLGRTGADAERRADLLVVLARAAVTAGDPAAGERDAHEARAVLGEEVDAALGARIDAVDAHVALERARLDDATALAHAAVRSAAATDQPAVECEALEVLGRAARVVDMESSERWFQRAADLAARRGLAGWHLRAQQELALAAWPRGNIGLLRETRELAAGYGALVTVAVMDLSLADIALSSFDRDGCLAASRACVAAGRRYGMATEPVAHLWLAGAHALAGDDAAMQAEVDEALARDPADPRILGDLYGRVLVTRSFVADDLGALRGHLDTMIEYVRLAAPGTSVFPGRLLWATLAAIDDDDLGVAARAEYSEAAEGMGMTVFLLARDTVEAIVLGRRGDAEGAAALMSGAHEALRASQLGFGMLHCQQVLAARAALRDGWGDPVAWLRETEAFFAAGGYERIARRCRVMLGEAGAPVPRRGRGGSAVPPSLRSLGVTSREVDVLRLVADGLSNKEIGAHLFLSTKTVERHLSSLFDRTAVRNRGALGELARAHGVHDG